MSWWDDNDPNVDGQSNIWNPTGAGETTPAAPPAAPAPTPPPAASVGNFGQYAWQQSEEGQQFFNHLKQLFPYLSDADIGANLNFDRMPDANFQQAIITNFAQHKPQQAGASTGGAAAAAQNSGNLRNDWDAFIKAKGYTGTYARKNMPAMVDEFNKQYGYGVKAGNPNAKGEIDGFHLPSGKFVDLVHGGDDAWQWLEEDGSSGGGGGGLGGAESVLSPWTVPFDYPSFEPPPQFHAPTADEALNDQGFQFTLKQGQQALERSAAAKGTLLTTGTLRDLEAQNQGLASLQYDKVYGRKQGEYEQAYGHAKDDWSTDYNKSLGEFRQGYDIWAANQDRPFNKLSTLAGMGSVANTSLMSAGQGYAGMYGNTQMGNANAMSNLWTNNANAQAASGMAGANAWGGAMNNIWGNFAPYMYSSMWGQPGRSSRYPSQASVYGN